MTASEHEFDLVVVGGGVSGWTAARRAQQLGLKVAVAEKWESGPGFGNGMLSGGVYHACYLDPLRPPADLHRAIVAATDGTARPDVARAWAENTGRAFRFLKSQGATYSRSGPLEWHNQCLEPRGTAEAYAQGRENSWRGRGPEVLMTSMLGDFVEAGGEFIPGSPARGLVMESGAVRGVQTGEAAAARRLRGRKVLLADGGIHSNRKLARTYFGSDQYLMRASDQNTGDGLQMGLAMGAATFSLDTFYAHLQHRDAVTNERLWMRPSLDLLCESSLVATGPGRRLGQSGPTFMHLCHEILRSESPGGSWVICDRRAWESIGRLEGLSAPNPGLYDLDVPPAAADDLAELARLLGMQERALAEAVREWNDVAAAAVQPSTWDGLAHPPVEQLQVASPPFFAVPLVVGMTFGLGGLLVNGHGQVLDRNEEPIPNLYAAGATMGGLQGGPNHGYAGGWSQASTFGLLAAEHAAASVRQAATPRDLGATAHAR